MRIMLTICFEDDSKTLLKYCENVVEIYSETFGIWEKYLS